jgi:hypothetical protein
MKPITFFDSYLKNLGLGNKFLGVSNINKDGGRTCRIDFTEEATKEDQILLYQLRDSYNWDQPDFWCPKVEEFISQVFDSLPPQGKLILAPYLNMLRSYINEPDRVQEMWNLIKESKFEWFSPELENKILEVASRTNIVLK